MWYKMIQQSLREKMILLVGFAHRVLKDLLAFQIGVAQ